MLDCCYTSQSIRSGPSLLANPSLRRDRHAFFLSILYTFLRLRVQREILFTYIQIAIDCLAVTVVIFVTGSFDSIFSFLYLVVIVYTSMLLYRRGSMTMAVVCSLLYLMLAGLEYLGMGPSV